MEWMRDKHKTGIKVLYAYLICLHFFHYIYTIINSSPSTVSFKYLPIPAPSQESNVIIHILWHIVGQMESIIKKNEINRLFATMNFALCLRKLPWRLSGVLDILWKFNNTIAWNYNVTCCSKHCACVNSLHVTILWKNCYCYPCLTNEESGTWRVK